MRFLLSLNALTAAAVLSGCATLDSLQPGQGSAFVVRGYTYDQVWQAVNQATVSRLTLRESDKANGVLKAESSAGLMTWGEVVGVFVKPANQPSPTYQIEVQSLKRSRGQITGTDWTNSLSDSIRSELLKIHYSR